MNKIKKLAMELNNECVKKGFNIVIAVENEDIIHSVRNVKDESRLRTLLDVLQNIYDED